MARFTLGTAVAAAAATMLVLAGCSANGTADEGGDKGSASSEPIQAVVLGGIGAEGILQNNATTSVTAAKASVAAVNAAGGIDGRQVELTVVDDTADPTVAVTKLRELLSGDNRPDVVMNSGPSTVSEAITPILSAEQTLSFNIGPTATTGDPSQSPFNFDLSPSVPDYLASFVAELKERGYKKVALLHGSSAYGELFGQLGEETFSEAGFEITGNEGYDNAALDMTPQLEKLRTGNPDVVVLDSYGAPLGYVLQGFEKLGWDVPIMGNNSVSATSLIATPAPDGVFGTDQVKNLTMQVFVSTKQDPANDHVNTAVENMVAAGDIKSSLIPAYNYDAMFLYKAAVESAGSTDAEAVAKALLDPKVQESANTAMLTLYSFTEDSHTPHAGPEQYLFIEPGEMVNGQFQ